MPSSCLLFIRTGHLAFQLLVKLYVTESQKVFNWKSWMDGIMISHEIVERCCS
ncbi:hypothetical protein GQ55_3G055200 [Panicum hallii var. hallii]|uniref:Uncharacterized protein n=1 Tax=Panicum hallii var. hallii TaxID=1504633 RepID=A0A2T7E617_9POAL|nr:hypothetical protein GQ55_3G055200 [Panicum hallii var. hallii]